MGETPVPPSPGCVVWVSPFMSLSLVLICDTVTRAVIGSFCSYHRVWTWTGPEWSLGREVSTGGGCHQRR